MNYKIVPADASDVINIFYFICKLEETKFNFTDFEGFYLANVRNENYIYLVARDETDNLIGYISCHGQILLHHCTKVFEIQELFVAEAYRKAGVGTLLIRTLQNELRLRGGKFLEVTANIKRTNTHEFYKKSGFIQTHIKFTQEIKPFFP